MIVLLKIDSFFISFSRKNYIGGVRIVFGIEHFDLEPISSIWSTFFHQRFGLCYQLNLGKSEKYEYIDVEDERPKLQMKITNTNPWKWAIVMLHSETDTADARQVHPYFYPRYERMNVHLSDICH